MLSFFLSFLFAILMFYTYTKLINLEYNSTSQLFRLGTFKQWYIIMFKTYNGRLLRLIQNEYEDEVLQLYTLYTLFETKNLLQYYVYIFIFSIPFI